MRRTSNAGAVWFPVDDFMANLAVTTIVINPADNNIVTDIFPQGIVIMNYNIPLHLKFSSWRAALHLALVALLVGAAPYRLAAQAGGDYVITQAVLAGGGGASSSVNYQLTGTVGQSLADSGVSSGGLYNLASGFWNPPQNAPAGVGLEGDVAARPDGNGFLSATDITQTRRFVASLDNATFGSEFQRADSAPRATFGNGLISATDITQTRRYVAALDASVNTNGPASPGGRPQPVAPQRDAPTGGNRIIRVVSQFVTPPNQVVVPIEIDSQGNEVAVSFSVNYDPAVLSVNNDPTRITLGDGVPAGTVLTRNANTPGRLGIVLDAGAPFTAGTRRMVNLTFNLLASLSVTNLSFGDLPTARDVSDDQAQSLTAAYQPGLVTITSPTLARVESYAAYHFPEGNLMQWQSSFEAANLGFEVYRQQGDERVLLTPSLVAGSALFAGAETRLTAGNSYAWQDPEGLPESVYWVRDIDLNGNKTWHGPILVKEPGEGQKAAAAQPDSPLLNELGSGAGENRWLRSYPALASEAPATLPEGSDAWLQQQRIAAGPAVKISVRASGWQHLSGAQLLAAGLAPLAEHRFLQLYAQGREWPLLVDAANPTITADSFVEFYGAGLDTRETDTNVYWLVSGDKPGLRVGPPVRVAPGQSADGSGSKQDNCADCLPPAAAASFAYTVERKERTIYFAALDNGEERENFFGPIVNNNLLTRNIPVTHLDLLSQSPARLQITLQGASADNHQVRVSLNGQELGVVEFSDKENKSAQFAVSPTALREGDNPLTLEALHGAADVSLVDTLKLTYAHLYEADNNRLRLTASTRQRLTVSGFTAPDARLFDVTDPARVCQIAARVEPTASGYALTANGNMRGRTLFAVADAASSAPAAVTANEPTNWTNTQRGVDFLILAHRSLRSEAQPLATLRNAQGLNTELITVEDIYDEFSGGVKEAKALTAFLRWTQTHWTRAPRYLLLVGDASYDPRNYLGLGDFDLMPTRYVGTPYLETASDEIMTDFDGDGIGEMAVGRLPARTLQETKAAFDKLLYFYQPANQSGALLVADRNEGFNFSGLNQEIRALLPDDTPVTMVNRAAGTDAEARQQILQALAQGPSIVNYTGHGSVQTWTGAGLLRTADATNLGNGNRLPFFVMMTCLNGYFHDLNSESLAEALVKAPQGGAIAAWGSSALTLPPQQAVMNRELLRQLYRPGAAPRLGDAVRQAKSAVTDASIRRTWILFGDPTLFIR